ncbi:MAG: hypothetical protein H6667_16810 [Ardenticatenaceae bacterium]|nr:hypothetical protein [Ardenticatenaceae bacterium]MCB9443112.1 hypothetical protein [Ardenticatenaceae bacterium]
MRLDQKREEELERRKGKTGKTIIQFIWLLISFVVAYFVVKFIIDAGYLTYNMIYGVGIPRSIPTIVITIVLMFVVVVFMQFFLFIGFMVANPEGRRRTGDPTLKSRTKDPYDYGRD